MYNNIIAKGFQSQYNLYGPIGDRVVKVAEVAKKKGLSKAEILKAMEDEIWRIGPRKVSNHAGDPNLVNVIDISPSTITNPKDFVREIKKRGIFLLQPPADPAFHLEIQQKQILP
jgi:tetrahydromethanopterin S-methyltransferase subunit H